MSIVITAAARARMNDFLGRHPEAAAIRFGVRRSGCSGYGYSVDLATERHADDVALEVDGVPLLVAGDALPLLDGTTIDFRQKGLNAAFAFDNPNAQAECGCGASFSVATRT